LPAIPTAVTFPPLPQPKLVLDLATPRGCQAQFTWLMIMSQDSLPAKDSHLSQKQSGSVMADRFQAAIESRKSNVLTTRPRM